MSEAFGFTGEPSGSYEGQHQAPDHEGQHQAPDHEGQHQADGVFDFSGEGFGFTGEPSGSYEGQHQAEAGHEQPSDAAQPTEVGHGESTGGHDFSTGSDGGHDFSTGSDGGHGLEA